MTIALAFDTIEGSQPEAAVAFLHGILGRGRNLHTLAARFVQARPDYSALLVDLRGHGRSPKDTPSPSLEAAASDVVQLARQSALPLRAIVGHSFGGKVALEVARIASTDELKHVVVIDSFPGSREPLRGGDSAPAVLDAIASLPPRLQSQSEFIDAIVAKGQTLQVARWLAGSLERDGDTVRFGPNPAEIRGLILDYFAKDLWPVVEHPPPTTRVHLVIGDRSSAYSPADRDRAFRLAASNNRVTVDVLPAGHWVHVDDPEGLLRVMDSALSLLP